MPLDNKVILILLMILIMLCTVSALQADTLSGSKQGNLYWVTAGPGLCTFGEFAGTAFGLSFTYQMNQHLFTFRFLSSQEILPIMPEDSIWEVGLLYGIATRDKRFLASLSGGFSLIGGQKRGNPTGFFLYEMVEYSAVGFPVEAQIIYKPLSFFGIGVSGFANMNSEKSYAGALLALQLGKLRH